MFLFKKGCGICLSLFSHVSIYSEISNKGGDTIITKEEKQIDIMIDEGLNAGAIHDNHEKKQLNSPISDKTESTRRNTMVEDFSEAKELGQAMETIKSNKEVKTKGMTPDPIQHK